MSMDAVRDLFDSLKAYLRDRFANPLYAGFVIAWAVLNFRLLLVLFGDGSWKEKISYIDNSLYTASWHWAWYGFGYPLCVASAYVLASPFIYRWVTVFLKTVEKQTLTQLLDVAGETPLPKEAADKLRRSLVEEQRKRIKEQRDANSNQVEQAALIAALSDQLADLKSAAGGTTGNLESASRSVKMLKDELESNEEIELNDGDLLPLQSNDFAGEPAFDVKNLVDRGLSRLHLNALYEVRNFDGFDAFNIKSALGLADDYKARVVIDRLRGLKVIELVRSEPAEFSVTSLGRQALDAVTSRGFIPSSQTRVSA